ncbi:hypothetical protein [Aneurinibacillus tyrosinisolvens]|uniref:hypothetical protein n=1 Tax=Aneurinibacillus tyrosinisolvens TaxID=1443435 RepID=UPI00063EE6D4|nr:hypothetical protein [Aneurinibacillus tyrosinisolvens]
MSMKEEFEYALAYDDWRDEREAKRLMKIMEQTSDLAELERLGKKIAQLMSSQSKPEKDKLLKTNEVDDLFGN